jgi:hypothetical protein
MSCATNKNNEQRETGKRHAHTFVPLGGGWRRRAHHGGVVRELAVVEPKVFVLAVAEGAVASVGSGSRQRAPKMAGVELPAATAHKLDRLGLSCRWGGGGR